MNETLKNLKICEDKIDILTEEVSTVFEPTSRAIKKIMMDKKKNEREDKYIRSKNELAIAGIKLTELKKKFKDKDVKNILETLGLAILQVSNDSDI